MSLVNHLKSYSHIVQKDIQDELTVSIEQFIKSTTRKKKSIFTLLGHITKAKKYNIGTLSQSFKN